MGGVFRGKGGLPGFWGRKREGFCGKKGIRLNREEDTGKGFRILGLVYFLFLFIFIRGKNGKIKLNSEQYISSLMCKKNSIMSGEETFI